MKTTLILMDFSKTPRKPANLRSKKIEKDQVLDMFRMTQSRTQNKGPTILNSTKKSDFFP